MSGEGLGSVPLKIPLFSKTNTLRKLLPMQKYKKNQYEDKQFVQPVLDEGSLGF